MKKNIIFFSLIYIVSTSIICQNGELSKKKFLDFTEIKNEINTIDATQETLQAFDFYSKALNETNADRKKEFFKQAFNLFQSAIKKESNPNNKAMIFVTVAQMYLGGYYVNINYLLAHKLFNYVKDQNDNLWAKALALSELAEMYLLVDGERNYKLIYEYLHEAANQDINRSAKAQAFTLLGMGYKYGDGVEQDLIKAEDYFKRAIGLNASPFYTFLSQQELSIRPNIKTTTLPTKETTETSTVPGSRKITLKEFLEAKTPESTDESAKPNIKKRTYSDFLENETPESTDVSIEPIPKKRKLGE